MSGVNLEKELARLRELENKKAGLVAKGEEAIAKVKAASGSKVAAVTLEIEGVKQVIEGHCKVNRKTLFPGDSKSVRLVNGTVGFRNSPPKVVISKAKEFAKRALEVFGKKAGDYLITTTKPDKDALKKLPPEKLKELKVKVTQKEEFYIDLGKPAANEKGYGQAVGVGKGEAA